MPSFAQLIPRFLLGDAEAIRRLAGYGPGLAVGACLVISAGIAREYDRVFVAERPQLFVLPVVASLAAATLLYGSLRLFALRGPRSGARGRYRAFLALFWLTAPLAWIYAVPVERFFAPVPAARLNIAFLAVVATWRVWLICRVAVVLFGVSPRRSFGAILLPSSLLVLGAGLFTQISLVPLMGGISLAPEARVLMRAAGVAAQGSVLVGAVALILLATSGNRPTPAVPPRLPGRFPAVPVAALLLLWIGLAAIPQLEVRRNAHVDALVADARYREALELLSSFEPRDLAPTRSIAPDPRRTGSGSSRHLPGLFAAMDGGEADWVRALYLDYLAVQIGSEYYRPSVEALTDYARALARLPEGAEFVRAHRADLERVATVHVERPPNGEDELAALPSMLEAVRALGIELRRPEAGER
jgi:hypothetical protein